jgi:hypothetical protein
VPSHMLGIENQSYHLLCSVTSFGAGGVGVHSVRLCHRVGTSLWNLGGLWEEGEDTVECWFGFLLHLWDGGSTQ